MSQEKKAPAGAVRQLQESDLGTKLVGWKPASTGAGSIVNAMGFAAVRVIVQKVVEGNLKDLYDQPIIVENAGAIVVCHAGDRIGLVQNFRFVGDRLMNAGKDYVRKLDAEGRWEELLATLGAWQWELPRGISQVESETDLEKFVVATAKAEALEESGYRIANARICGRLNMNPTFFAHSQYVVKGEVVSIGERRPEETEIIGATKLFCDDEIRAMADRGEIQDGMTFAALALAGFCF
jgi:8-oxo-dGTP pyrophosphatase MutT (NUDIX family)